MKKSTLLFMLTVSAVLMARESNLINNSAFGRGLLHWNYEGNGQCRLQNRKPLFSSGVLYHYFDLGNTEHADPECGLPVNRVFRFRVKANQLYRNGTAAGAGTGQKKLGRNLADPFPGRHLIVNALVHVEIAGVALQHDVFQIGFGCRFIGHDHDVCAEAVFQRLHAAAQS